jgi:hypothetical protein
MGLSVYILLADGARPQDTGLIRGTVTDENGAPIAKAKVNADPADGRPRASLVHFVETDEGGRFLIERLSWGKYKVFAKKEDAGYPDLHWSFYSNDVFQTAIITPEAPSAELQIRLGPKAAIMTGSVTNGATGAPVTADFKLIRARSSDKWISTSKRSDYRVLLPPSTEILVEVSAPGFRTWSFPSTLNLQPGTEMHVDISLEPEHDPNIHPSKLLVPSGYIGWLLLEHNVKNAEPVPIEDGVKVFKFPESGVLYTSSPGPERGADDEYLYYSQDGSRHQIPKDYRGGKGMIWGQYEGSRGGVMTLFGFFVGTEEHYRKHQSQAGHPGPIQVQPVPRNPQ